MKRFRYFDDQPACACASALSKVNVTLVPGKPRETFRVGNALRFRGGLVDGQSTMKGRAKVKV